MPERVAFAYNRRHRLLDNPRVRFTKKLDLIIVGTDPDKGETRSFRVDRIRGAIKHVPAQRENPPL